MTQEEIYKLVKNDALVTLKKYKDRPTFEQVHKDSFIKGFQTAQQNLFTEIDLVKAILFATSINTDGKKITPGEAIEKVKQDKIKK